MNPVKTEIAQLIELQKKDTNLSKIEAELKKVPAQKAAVEAGREAIDRHLAAEKSLLADMENKRQQMRTARRANEDKIVNYRTQLLKVRKNEDYTALEAEISRIKAQTEENEESEIQLLMDIDAKSESIRELEASSLVQKEALKNKMCEIDRLSAELEATRTAAQAQFEGQTKLVLPAYLNAYQRVKKSGKKPPYVVKLENGHCGGCFLKLSGAEIDAVTASDPQTPVFCEHCGRILYSE